MATGDRPTTAPGWELFPQMHALIDAADPRFTLVATVQEAADVMTWLEALTTVAPAAVEARLGASLIVRAAFFPAATANPSMVCTPNPGAWMVSG